MTKELLEQYPDICAELADLERAARTPVSDVVSGSSGEYPYTQHAVTIRGLPAEQHRSRIEKLKRQKTEIEQFVFTLPNARIRRIATADIEIFRSNPVHGGRIVVVAGNTLPR